MMNKLINLVYFNAIEELIPCIDQFVRIGYFWSTQNHGPDQACCISFIRYSDLEIALIGSLVVK